MGQCFQGISKVFLSFCLNTVWRKKTHENTVGKGFYEEMSIFTLNWQGVHRYLKGSQMI